MEMQAKQLRDDANETGVVWVHGGLITDGQSAWKVPFAKRKGGGELFGKLREGDHITFLRMDRAFRDLCDFVNTHKYWRERGITMSFIDHPIPTEGPFGDAMLGVMAVFAQLESAMRSQRQKDVWAERRAAGNVLSHPGSRRRGTQLIHDDDGTPREVDDLQIRWIVKVVTFYRERTKKPWQHISDVLETRLAEREFREYCREPAHAGPDRPFRVRRLQNLYADRHRILP
jgi:DNA invertase Pin-like site-specific DNA recombinase